MEWIRFDVEKLKELKEVYEEAMYSIAEQLPKMNLNSRKEVIQFFGESLNIELQSSRIKEIESHLTKFTTDQEEYYILLGVTYYYKIKYSLKNYINHILSKENNGIVYLRHWWGNWVMPNKQPLPASPEILDCVIEHSPNIKLGGK